MCELRIKTQLKRILEIKLLLIFLVINIMMLKSQNNNNKIYIGGGCFWCIEAIFEDVIGVQNVTNGYAGGQLKEPTYKEVSSGLTNHAEVCEITYNEKKINLNSLLKIFFLSHDPTTKNKQGNDSGKQYRSIIFYESEIEKKEIEEYLNYLQKNIFEKKIVTEIQKLEKFYIAEKYHQNFYKLNTETPYCKVIINPKIKELRRKLKKYY